MELGEAEGMAKWKGSKVEMTVEEVIEEHVGSLGFSQLLHAFVVLLAWMFDSQTTWVAIFADAQPLSSRLPTSRRNASMACASSTIAEWGLIGDRKFLAAMPTSLFFLGSLLGNGAYRWLANSLLGSKRTLVLSCLLTSTTAFLTSVSPNLWTYAFLRFANGVARSGIAPCCHMLSSEAIGQKWCRQVSHHGIFFFTTGFLSLPLIAYPTRNCWRNLYIVISALPLVYSVCVLPFIAESPRWLLAQGRSREALDVLKQHACLNGKKLPENLVLLADQSGVSLPSSETKVNLQSTKWAAKRSVIVMMVGFGVGFVYYGIQLNAENLSFSLYFTVALNSMMEIPAVFIGGVLLSFTNRRLLFSRTVCIAGTLCILCISFSHGRSGKADEYEAESSPQLAVESVGFMAASMAFHVLYFYCTELFPSNVRNVAVSLLHHSLILGASAAPLLVVLGRQSPSLSFLGFGVVSISCALVSFWLPKTQDALACETLEQQEEEKLNPLYKDLELQLRE